MVGGAFAVNGTAGQHVAGTSSNSNPSRFDLHGGFWFQNLAPTAAAVSISGRVTTADGRGIRNVRVSLTDQSGNVRTVLTSSFGYYRFDDIEAGQTVVLSVSAKRYVFANPTRVLGVLDELTDIDFTAEPQ